jgi:hypothetical protein
MIEVQLSEQELVEKIQSLTTDIALINKNIDIINAKLSDLDIYIKKPLQIIMNDVASLKCSHDEFVRIKGSIFIGLAISFIGALAIGLVHVIKLYLFN